MKYNRSLAPTFVLLLTTFQPACVVVGGYNSERGWYVWPGSFLSIFAAVLIFFLLRRRRR